MLVRTLDDCAEFTAGDNTRLREILHPDKMLLDLRYSLAWARVEAGHTSYSHRLSVSEAYYILQGRGEMRIDGESRVVEPGDTVYIPPNATQCITALGPGDLAFLCIVDPAWQPEVEFVTAREDNTS